MRAIPGFAPPDGLFHLARRGDVLGDSGETIHAAGFVFDRKAAVSDPADAAVGTDDAILLVIGDGPLAGGGGFNPSAVLRMHAVKPYVRSRVEFGSRVAPNLLKGGTHVNHFLPIGRDQPKDGVDVFGQLAEPFFALLDGIRHAPPFRDIAHHREHADDPPVSVPKRGIGPFAQDPLPGLGQILVRAVGREIPCEEAVPDPINQWLDLSGYEEGGMASHDFLCPIAEDPFRSRIPGPDPEVGVAQNMADRHLGNLLPEQALT